jgi:hypothetical protein
VQTAFKEIKKLASTSRRFDCVPEDKNQFSCGLFDFDWKILASVRKNDAFDEIIRKVLQILGAEAIFMMMLLQFHITLK